MSTKKLWLHFLLYSEGSGNAATILWSPVFASRFYRVGKFSIVNASNQSIYCLLMNWKRGLFPLHCQSPATLPYILCSLDHFYKTPWSPMLVHPFFPRAKLSESTNFECVQFYYKSVDYQSLNPQCVHFSQYWDKSY